MSKITVLDCTLRDGGYVNDWKFGIPQAQDIAAKVAASGVEYVELGFIRLCDYVPGQIVFNHVRQAAELFRPSPAKLVGIVEIGYDYPVTSFPERSADTVDMVRVVLWKRMQDRAFDYCKALIDKGYEVGVQATRTEQYTTEEFAALAERFSALGPKAIYIVDTFGLLTRERLLGYARAAAPALAPGVSLGYHAHNNMQQAFSNAVALAEARLGRDLMLDGSVLGMGRGAGNLPLELLLKYLNEHHLGAYDTAPLLDVACQHIEPLFREKPWGYSIPFLLSATYERNPSYVDMLKAKGLTNAQMAQVFATMKERGVGITFDTAMCDALVDEVLKG